MKRIPTIIIGAGIIAREHVDALQKLDQFSLVGIADIDVEKAKLFATEFNLSEIYRSTSEALEQSNAELFIIATPPAFHEADTVAALEKGKYIVCEKPIAHTLEASHRILKAAEKHPNQLSVGHQLRFSHSHRRLRWLCENGAIGDLQNATVERHGEVPSLHQNTTGWWGKWEIAGGGVAITQMIHELDLLIAVLGEPISVTAKIDTCFTRIDSEDAFEALVKFPEDRFAVCRGSVNSGRPSGIFRVVGSSGSVDIHGNLTLPDRDDLSRSRRQVNRALPDTKPPSTSLQARVYRKFLSKLGHHPKQEDPHLEFYRALAQSIREGRELPVSGQSALPALDLCMGIYESGLKGGQEVSLPLTPDSQIYRGISAADYQSRPPQNVPHIAPRQPQGIRVGLLGCDTSHAPTFANLLNNPSAPNHIPGARVVAAWPGGSDDMEISRSRVPGFVQELQYQYGVPIHEEVETVAQACDVLIITASDGRIHPELLEKTASFGKPTFIDKPFAISNGDMVRMAEIADDKSLPLIGSSAFRYADGLIDTLVKLRENGEIIQRCEINCWLPIQPTQGRYFWYGIHASEMLVASMGRGAESVNAKGDDATDTIEVRYPDGRSGRINGSRDDGAFSVELTTDQNEYEIDLAGSMFTISARLLHAALDQLGGDFERRLWRATDCGSLCADRNSRVIDPDLVETGEVVAILEAAQASFESHKWEPVASPQFPPVVQNETLLTS